MTAPLPGGSLSRTTSAPVGTRRPGGRTARTRESAASAVRALVDAGAPVTFSDVAERASVNVTTLYRRWATPQALVIDVLQDEIEPAAPEPRGDGLRDALTAYAVRLADAVMTPRGVAYLHALIQATGDPRVPATITDGVVGARLASYGVILAATGGAQLRPRDLLDGIFAPLSLHAMLATPFQPDGEEIAQYVDNLCRLAASRGGELPAD